MRAAQSLRLRRIAIGAAIAGLGTFGFADYVWWSYRGSVPHPDVSAAILILVAIGAAAGLLSGRLRDAPVAWAAAATGWALAYQANYIIDPAWPTSDSSFGGAVADCDLPAPACRRRPPAGCVARSREPDCA